ncbi:Ig-like domain-containing protein [Myxococcus stipitatus]|uniref:Ig-like domain-containing protein n=1 Tax=Myxococcus stipitatus TaxID=83455 RepID=UPI0030CC1520
MKTPGWIHVLTCAVALAALPAFAEADVFGLGSGRDKALTVQGHESRVVNSYAAVTAPLNKGAREIRVDTLQGFDDGDLVMVLQTRDVGPVPASSFMAFTLPLFDESPVGLWELARVERAMGRSLMLTRPLLHDFAAPYTQVIRVPEFKSVTVHPLGEIKARAWNGTTGGVVAFLVDGTLHNNGVITASGAGFQQGWVNESDNLALGCVNDRGTCERVTSDVLLRRLPMGGGGAIFFRAHALIGAGRIEAKGVPGPGAPGGGSISARLVERAECEVLSVQGAPSSSPWVSGAQGGTGGGTVLLQAGTFTGCPVRVSEVEARIAALGPSQTGDTGGQVLWEHPLVIPMAPLFSSPGDGVRLKNAMPRLSGLGDPGATVFLSLEDIERPSLGPVDLPSTRVDESGGFTLEVPAPLSDGTYALTAYTELEGLTSPTSPAIYFTVDGQLAASAPTILVPEEDEVVGTHFPTFSGRATANLLVRVLRNGIPIGETRANSSKDWSVVSNTQFDPGPATVTAVIIDADGNPGTEASRSFVVAIPPPLVPVFVTPVPGSTVNTTKPVFTGTARRGNTVRILHEGTEIASATVDTDDTWTATATTALPQGNISVTATATNSIGETSTASAAHTFDVDTVAPNAPVIETPTSGTTVATTRPTFTGTAEIGSTVRIFHGATEIGFATTAATGRFTVTATTALPQDSVSVTATATDASGNTSTASAARNFKVDTVAPGVPVFDSPASGTTVASTRPTLAGTAEIGSTVRIFHGATEIGFGTTAATGRFSITATTDLPQDSVSVTATATDTANNTSTPSAAHSFFIDTVAPGAPVIETPASGTTVTTTKPTFTGTAEVGSTVRIFRGGSELGFATTGVDGRFSVTATTALPEGSVSVTATATDAPGNAGPASAAHAFSVDSVAPSAPVIDTPAAGITITTTTPTFAGTAEADSIVRIFRNGTELGFATTAATGRFSVTVTTALPQGSISVTATATDVPGNTSTASAPHSFSVDSVAPDAPVFETPAAGTTVATTTPTFKGTAEAGSIVRIFRDGNELGFTTTAADRKFSVTTTTALPQGLISVTATATDALGNTSTASAPHSFSIDSQPPQPPAFESPDVNALVNTATPTFEGTAEVGSTIRILRNGSQIGIGNTGGDGRWTATATTALPQGSVSVTATATDAVGNTSAASPPHTFTVDSRAPNPPAIEKPDANSSVNTAQPLFTGTAEAGSTVNILFGGNPIGSGVTGGDNKWTVSPTSPLPEGSVSVTATATDAAGNTSAPSAARGFKVDTRFPDPPVIQSPGPNARVGTATPTFSGEAEPDASIIIFVDGTHLATIPANSSGRWSTPSTRTLSEASHVVTATATDAAGNKGPEARHTFEVDLSAPLAPVISAPAADTSVGTTTPTFSGSAEAESTVRITYNGSEIGSGPAALDGAWSITSNTALPQGTVIVTATATDVAGNRSPASAPRRFIVDTIAPPAPSISKPATREWVTVATPVFEGTADPNSTVNVLRNGSVIATGKAGTDSKWQLTANTNLPEGDITVTATATDEASNVGPASAPRDFRIDTIAPSQPTFSQPGAGVHLNKNTPTFAGTADEGSKVRIYRKQGNTDVFIEEVTAGVGNQWTYTVTAAKAFPEGLVTVTATARDEAGNNSAPAVSLQFTVDTVLPEKPQINVPIPSVVITNRPVISGTVVGGSTVTLSADGTVLGTAPVTSGGDWTYTPTTNLAEGSRFIEVYATDEATNRGPTASKTFIVDTTPPPPPRIEVPVVGTRVGPNGTEFRGTAEPGSTVNVYLTDPMGIRHTVATDDADPNGIWSVPTTRVNVHGDQLVMTATATDVFLREGLPSPDIRISVDIEAPPTPTFDTPKDNQVFNKRRPDFTGSTTAGARVTVQVSGFEEPTVTADGNGKWTVSSSRDLLEFPNSYSVQAWAADDLGNVSKRSSAIPFTIDVTKPVTKIVAPLDDATLTDPAPLIRGTSEPNSTVTLSLGATTFPNIPVNNDGIWRYQSGPLAHGKYTVQASAVDRAGNAGETATITFTLDLVLPDAPKVTIPGPGTFVNVPRPTIRGTTTKPCAKVVVKVNDVRQEPAAVVDSGGAWKFTPSADLPEKENKVAAFCLDGFDRESEDSASHSFTVDTQKPGVPIIETPEAGSFNGPTFDTVTGTAEPETLITATLNGLAVGTAQADSTGRWSLKIGLTILHGEQRFQATTTDRAQNVSAPSAPHVFKVDKTKPVSVLTGVPEGTSALSTVTFSMGTKDPEDNATFRCSLDGEPLSPCVSPHTLRGLPEGRRELIVEATDRVGNVEEAPIHHVWDVRHPSAVEGGGVGCSSTAGPIPGAVLWLAWVGWLGLRRRRS